MVFSGGCARFCPTPPLTLTLISLLRCGPPFSFTLKQSNRFHRAPCVLHHPSSPTIPFLVAPGSRSRKPPPPNNRPYFSFCRSCPQQTLLFVFLRLFFRRAPPFVSRPYPVPAPATPPSLFNARFLRPGFSPLLLPAHGFHPVPGPRFEAFTGFDTVSPRSPNPPTLFLLRMKDFVALQVLRTLSSVELVFFSNLLVFFQKPGFF